jgi:hypothetical protein
MWHRGVAQSGALGADSHSPSIHSSFQMVSVAYAIIH